jgi:hypothetical protein
MAIKIPEVITCECSGEYFSKILVLLFRATQFINETGFDCRAHG